MLPYFVHSLSRTVQSVVFGLFVAFCLFSAVTNVHEHPPKHHLYCDIAKPQASPSVFYAPWFLPEDPPIKVNTSPSTLLRYASYSRFSVFCHEFSGGILGPRSMLFCPMHRIHRSIEYVPSVYRRKLPENSFKVCHCFFLFSTRILRRP